MDKQAEVSDLVRNTSKQIDTYSSQIDSEQSAAKELLEKVNSQEAVIDSLMKQQKDEEAAAALQRRRPRRKQQERQRRKPQNSRLQSRVPHRDPPRIMTTYRKKLLPIRKLHRKAQSRKIPPQMIPKENIWADSD